MNTEIDGSAFGALPNLTIIAAEESEAAAFVESPLALRRKGLTKQIDAL